MVFVYFNFFFLKKNTKKKTKKKGTYFTVSDVNSLDDVIRSMDYKHEYFGAEFKEYAASRGIVDPFYATKLIVTRKESKLNAKDESRIYIDLEFADGNYEFWKDLFKNNKNVCHILTNMATDPEIKDFGFQEKKE